MSILAFLDSKAEINRVFAQSKAAHAKIVSEREDKPRKLREFMAADLDGNLIRAFYDYEIIISFASDDSRGR